MGYGLGLGKIMTSTEWGAFALGIVALLVVIGLGSVLYHAGRGQQIHDVKQDIRLCGADRIECYQKVLGMENQK